MFRQVPERPSAGLAKDVGNLMQRLLQQKQLAADEAYKQQQLSIAKSQLGMQQQELPLKLKEMESIIRQREAESKKAEAQQILYNQIFGTGEEKSTSILPNKNIPSIKETFPNQLLPSDPKQIHNLLQSGQEVVIRPPESPQKALQDRAPGSTVMGIKIPDIRSNVVDGIRYDTYPSGKVVAQKVGPSTEEKAEISLTAAEKKEQAKANIKRSEDIKATMKMLQDYSHHVESLAELLEKKKNVSGLLSGYKTKFKAGSPESAIFQSHATPMVGTLAKNISQRGGAVAAGIAQAGKPDIFQPHSYNISMINEQAKGVYNTYKNAKEEWEQLHPGKEFPFKLSKFYDKVRVRAPNGLTYIKTQKEAENLVKKYPSSEILGNIYE